MKQTQNICKPYFFIQLLENINETLAVNHVTNDLKQTKTFESNELLNQIFQEKPSWSHSQSELLMKVKFIWVFSLEYSSSLDCLSHKFWISFILNCHLNSLSMRCEH